MRRQCSAITRSGERCTHFVSGAQEFCHLHDPARSEERRRNASRAGKSKPSRKIAAIRSQLKKLVEDVLSEELPTGPAAVANQLLNTMLRSIELERRIKETEELEERLEALESVLKGRKIG